MKKLFFIPVYFIFALFISGCSSVNSSSLGGFYQSSRIDNAYIIQISVYTDEMKFVEYINNREVDKGEYIITNDTSNKKTSINWRNKNY